MKVDATAEGVRNVEERVRTLGFKPNRIPGSERKDAAWYQPGSVGYLSVLAREESGWISSP